MVIYYLDHNAFVTEFRETAKMSKFMLLVFVTLVASTLIVAAPDKSRCGRHGDPVSTHLYTTFFLLCRSFLIISLILSNLMLLCYLF